MIIPRTPELKVTSWPLMQEGSPTIRATIPLTSRTRPISLMSNWRLLRAVRPSASRGSTTGGGVALADVGHGVSQLVPPGAVEDGIVQADGHAGDHRVVQRLE